MWAGGYRAYPHSKSGWCAYSLYRVDVARIFAAGEGALGARSHMCSIIFDVWGDKGSLEKNSKFLGRAFQKKISHLITGYSDA